MDLELPTVIRGMAYTRDKLEELRNLREVAKMDNMNITVNFQEYDEKKFGKWNATRYTINIFDDKSMMYFKLRFKGTLI